LAVDHQSTELLDIIMAIFKTTSSYHESNLNKSEIDALDLIQVGKDEYHIIINGKSYNARMISGNFEQKEYVIEINGNRHTIHIMDEYDQLIEKMGLFNGKSQKIGSINAPMPGKILDIMIEKNQEIKKGDHLFILEAMKMENVIKAEGDGIVKSIEIKIGDTVEKGQLIIQMK